MRLQSEQKSSLRPQFVTSLWRIYNSEKLLQVATPDSPQIPSPTGKVIKTYIQSVITVSLVQSSVHKFREREVEFKERTAEEKFIVVKEE